MKFRSIPFLAAFVFSFFSLKAQEAVDSNADFHIQGRIINEQMVIKIIPGNQAAWYLGMKNGYKVSIAIYENDAFSDYIVIQENLRPSEENEFEDQSLPKEYADVMRKIIYEESYAAPGNSFDDMLAADKNLSRLYLSYLLVSSYSPTLSELSGLQTKLPEDLPSQFKIKVEVNNYSSYDFEQLLQKVQFYSNLDSPDFTLKLEDKTCTAEWNHINKRHIFIAYTLERSEDNKNFKKRGSPVIFNSISAAGQIGMISKQDSLADNYKDYWYRLRGYDAFGYLSEIEEAIRIQGRDLTPPQIPTRVNVKQLSPEMVNITWVHNPSPDLAGFQVIASLSEDGQYNLLHEDLLAPSERSFNYDISTNLFRFYRILAVDTSRNAKASSLGYLVVYDTIPPAIPSNIQVLVDSNHVATITWSASKDDDIYAYRVYKAYHPSHGFVPITPTPISDTLFTDSISNKRLDKKVYYKVAALDKHYNHSETSKYSYAKIPDFIPPTEPLLKKATLNSSGHVELEWIPSSSADIASYSVLRKVEYDSVYQTLHTLHLSQNDVIDIFFDTLSVSYAEYYIVAIDSSGNASDRSNGKRVLKPKKSSESEISISSINEINNTVKLDWIYNSDNKYSVLVYRSVEDGKFKLIDRVNDDYVYIDKNVDSGKEYSYKISVLESSGKRPSLSEGTSIHLK